MAGFLGPPSRPEVLVRVSGPRLRRRARRGVPAARRADTARHGRSGGFTRIRRPLASAGDSSTAAPTGHRQPSAAPPATAPPSRLDAGDRAGRARRSAPYKGDLRPLLGALAGAAPPILSVNPAVRVQRLPPARISMAMIAAASQSTTRQKGRPPPGVCDKLAAVLPKILEPVGRKTIEPPERERRLLRTRVPTWPAYAPPAWSRRDLRFSYLRLRKSAVLAAGTNSRSRTDCEAAYPACPALTAPGVGDQLRVGAELAADGCRTTSASESFAERLREDPGRTWQPVELVDHAARHGRWCFPPRGVSSTQTLAT